MDENLDKKLCEDFPLLYADRNASMQTTCMCWGFPGDGWHSIIRELSSKLESLIQKFIDENPNLPCRWCSVKKDVHEQGWHSKGKWEDDGVSKHYVCHGPNGYEAEYPRASQVKEKYASLRFYMTSASNEMYDLIREYERKSTITCEDCGAPGKLRGGRYYVTQCDDCAKGKPEILRIIS